MTPHTPGCQAAGIGVRGATARPGLAVAGGRGPLRQRLFRAAAGVAAWLAMAAGGGSARRRWLLAVRRV
jgi:hypothetical protein